MRKLLLLFGIVVVAYAGFRWGPVVFPPLERALGIPGAPAAEAEPEPTPELADATLDRFEAFRAGEGEDRLALSGLELSSVVRYALPGIVPPGVVDPTVRIDEGRMHLSARVAVESFPDLPRLEQVIGLLPDTMLVEMRGTLVPLDQEHLSFLVERLSAAKIPIPARLVSQMLTGLGREGPVSLPDDALLVPIPDGVESVFVQADSLVLLGAEPPGGR